MRVSFQTKIDSGIKYYIVDITIEWSPTFKDYLLAETPIGGFVNVVPEVKIAIAGNPDDSGKKWNPNAKLRLGNMFKSKSSG